ncbi:MAG: hypothetical protein JRI23_31880 [Deltaproteobacteria bacterium]|jgi:hypothetical protein|nr:hypothetical protein [Deltaproteobacteria bacterium]MBW2536824.1 hypothetical protein [Deltaproteobacteria bacterium]
MRRRTTATTVLVALVALTWALAPGCAADDETTRSATPDAGADADVDAGSGGSAPIRTVETRHPLGNVAKTHNLLWDGDFEWTYPFADQYGWFIGEGGYLTYGNPDTVIGAACQSGIKCAELADGGFLVGVGVASRGNALAASFAAKPHAGCAGVAGVLVDAYFSGSQVELTPTSDLPDESGWCRYYGEVSERQNAQWLYIENRSGEPALVDDAAVEPVEPRALHYRGPKLSPERIAYYDRVRQQVLERLEPGDPPPNPDRLIFEEKLEHMRFVRRRPK